MRPLPSARHQLMLDRESAYRRAVTVELERGSRTATVSPEALSVTADGGSLFHWSGQASVAVDAPPTDPDDLLTEYGTVATVRLGVELSDGSVSTVPYGRMLVTAAPPTYRASGATVALVLSDLAVGVEDSGFAAPYTVAAGVDLYELAAEVVDSRQGRIALGGDPVGVTTRRKVTFGLDPNVRPWSELTRVCAAYGFRPWVDREGSLALAPTGQVAGSRTIGRYLSLARSPHGRRPNVVVVSSSDPALDPPIRVEVSDDDPDSPTYVAGPYGRVTTSYASPLLATVDDALQAGTTILARLAREAATWQLTVGYDPTLDPGDGIETAPSGPLVVDVVTVDAAGTTSVLARETGGG